MMSPGRTRRGRPLKFNRPSRAVTLTLPEDVIGALGRSDSDLSRAVVRLALPLAGQPKSPPAETSRFGNGAVIVVPPHRALADINGVELVPLADGRALIALDDDMTAADFELAIRDAIDAPDVEDAAREVLAGIADILRRARASGRVTTRRIMVVPAES